MNISVKHPKPGIFAESPLKGTFTDAFAMYSTFSDVENCSVKMAINPNGSEILKSITEMFSETEKGVLDFFIYYSGIGKSFNGDWLSYDPNNDKLNIVPLTAIVSKWKARPNASKQQYLLIISDTNYSGIWVSKAKDYKTLQKHNIIVQSAVGREEASCEMAIGEIKPPCWVTQIVCGKFTHNWLEIASSQFYAIDNAVVDIKGSFVVLNKQMVWDQNEEYFAMTDTPMSNVFGANDEKTMVIIPAFGYNLESEFNNDSDDIESELQIVWSEMATEEKSESSVQYMALKSGTKQKLKPVQRRTSHLPQPSVRRVNLLQSVLGGLKLKKHKKKKSRHVSTYSRGFVFTKVLTDIRHMVMGSDDDENDGNDDDPDWIDD